MKKILLVAASVTLLAAGCQKTEIVNPVGEPAMTFSTGMKKLTKAVGTADAASDGMVNLQAQDFRVWAYGDFEDENTLNTKELDEIYDGMANLHVTYSEVKHATDTSKMVGSWLPAKEYYWPGVNKNLRFFAVSGANLGADLSQTNVVSIDINRTDSVTVSPTLTVNAFTVDHTNPNTDLMVADFVCQNQSKKEVELNFRHALSKVEFLFKTLPGSDRDVFVQSLEVVGINTTSTLTVTSVDTTDLGGKPINFEWDTPTVPQTFADDYTGTASDFPANVEYITEEKEQTTEAGDTVKVKVQKYPADTTVMKLTETAETFATWLVMPQEITAGNAGDLQVKVLYVIGERQFESIFTLGSDTLPSWESNQYVRYTITLAPNLISFVPKVEDWDTATEKEFEN